MDEDTLAAHLQAALAARRVGDAPAADAALRAVLALEPAHPGAAHLLGVMALERADAAAALAWFDLALRAGSSFAPLHFNRGNALAALQRLDQAAAAYRQCIALDPAQAEAHYNLGNVLAGAGQAVPALVAYGQALQLRPGLAEAWRRVGMLQADAGRYAEAVASFDRLLALDAGDADAWNRRGVALHQQRLFPDALHCYDRAITLSPTLADAWNNRGNALHDLRQVDQAIAAYTQALALDPRSPEATVNLGMLEQETGRFDAARDRYQRAQALRPRYAEAARRLAGLDLLQGHFAAGWAGFERALDWSEQGAAASRVPRWRGEPLAGRHILLSEPNGIGDTLQFFRFVPRLLAAGARVSFSGPRQIRALLRGFADRVEFVDDAGGGYDFRAMLWSLPHYLGIDEAALRMDAPYLALDRSRVARWSHLAEPGAINIGICWQGNPTRKIDALRSISLASFAPVAQVPGVRLVSLQRGHGLDQLANLPVGMRVIVPEEGFDAGPDAFADSAALMQSLDLVLSADSAITHVAAGLGRPAWLALARVPDWRWMLDRADSPWYPSVRLFRQHRLDDWTPVFDQVADALAGTGKDHPC